MDTTQLPAEGPLGVYIHVPYCAHRCPYCDFYLRVGRPDAAFVDRVLEQWTHMAPRLGPGARLGSVYWGGGTPGLLEPRAVARVMEAIHAHTPLAPGAEVTLEVNPNDCLDARLVGWRAAGVTRVSLGVQSLRDHTLKGLGRDHKADGARAALKAVARAGFFSWSADVIFGHPVQTAQELLEELRELADAAPHLSAYCLTYEPGTTLDRWREKGRVVPISNAQEAALYEQVQEHLHALGFQQYEVSSHARPGHAAVHNRLYWAGHSTLGLGPAAASYVRAANGTARRWRHAPDLDAFLRGGVPEVDVDDMAAPAALLDRIFTGLRDMQRGVDLVALESDHGVAVTRAVEEALRAEVALGALKEVRARHFVLTRGGALWADRVARNVLTAR